VNSLKVILATLVIFASGVVTGGLLVFHTQTQPALAADLAPPLPAPWLLQRVDFLRSIRANLDLSTAQETKIQQIIHSSQERLRPLWEQINPQLQDELKRVRQQISAQLNPAQQARFNHLLRARNNRAGDQLPAMENRRQLRLMMPGGGFRHAPIQSLQPGAGGAAASTNNPEVD
jgi:hypothetical protein